MTWLPSWYLAIAYVVLNFQLQCDAVSLEEDFFSHGSSTSDEAVVGEDDANGIIHIPDDVSYPFFGRNLPSTVYVSLLFL